MKGKVKKASLLFGVFILLVGCGLPNVANTISDRYPLEDVVASSTNRDDTAQVFVAENESISDVSSYIQDERKPNNTSEVKDNKQILVYDDYFVTLTADEANPENTLIEVASTGFARDNYSPSFFEGYLAYRILDQIFDVADWRKRQNQRCITANNNACYQGYGTSGGYYKGPTAPTLRGPGVRGGGPGTGK
jgi:hypothetical protein